MNAECGWRGPAHPEITWTYTVRTVVNGHETTCTKVYRCDATAHPEPFLVSMVTTPAEQVPT